ncbi:MAG TPA: DEAD/DEAH box helicase family protein [bacterium]|nr:DEAD/DEAH box helicase family protein [bacterium]
MPPLLGAVAYFPPPGPLGALLASAPDTALAFLASQTFDFMGDYAHLEPLSISLREAFDNDPSQARNLLNYAFSLPRFRKIFETDFSPSLPAAFRPRPYQAEFLEGLRRDLREASHPLLGLVSPMQTGKSLSAGKIISLLDRMFGEQNVLVLSSSRVITSQLLEDLGLMLSPDDLGRFDGLQKQVRRVTVASVFSLVRRLDDFDRHHFRFVINDEAYFAKAPIWQKVLDYFLYDHLIAFSGTGQGLEEYKISGRLDFLRAIEEGWMRDMEGERAFMAGEFTRQHSSLEQMIWWKPTSENARALAEVYGERIKGRFEKNLVYAPTIRHAELVKEVFWEKWGATSAAVLHSDLSETEAVRRLTAWRNRDVEALISIRKLAFGFRGKDAGAVFHTYQTTSPELFSQRTGRAWGVETGKEPALYVLEAAWDLNSPLMNLARLFGIQSYPERRFTTRGLRKRVERQKQIEDHERQASQEMGEEAREVFEAIPVLPEWRSFVRKASAMETSIPRERWEGYLFGFLPVVKEDVESLEKVIPGATLAWVKGWERVAEEVLEGLRGLKRGEDALKSWKASTSETPEDRAEALGEVLGTIFREKRSCAVANDQEVLDAFRRAIGENKEGISRGTMFPNTLADRAHALYVAGLPEGAKPPSRMTFRSWVGTARTARPEVLRLLEEAGIKKRAIDSQKIVEAFRQAIDENRDGIVRGKIFPSSLAARAHAIYVANLPEGTRTPRPGTFRTWIGTGPNARPEVAKLLENAGVRKQERVLAIDHPWVLRAFRRAIDENRDAIARGEVFPMTLADRARAIYVANLPEGTRPPRRGTFRSWVGTGPDARPEVVKLLEEAGVGKRECAHTPDDQKVLDAFRRAIDENKEGISQGTMFPNILADQAHALYVAGLPEGTRPPSRGTFRKWVGTGRDARPEVAKLLEEAGMKRRAIDSQKVVDAFRRAIDENRDGIARGKVFPMTLAERARAIYVTNLPEGTRPPRRGTFRGWVAGRNARPEVVTLLEEAGVGKRECVQTPDDQKVLDAFRRAIDENEEGISQGTMLSHILADRARALYAADLPEGAKPPSRGTFRGWVAGRTARPEVVTLFEEAGMRKQERVLAIDHPWVLRAFRQAIEENRDGIARGKVFPSSLAARAHAIYVANLPEGTRTPRPGTFRTWIGTRRKDWPEVAKLLEEAGVRKRMKKDAI